MPVGTLCYFQVIIVGSIDASTRQGQQLEGLQLRYSTADSDSVQVCKDLNFLALEVRLQILICAVHFAMQYFVSSSDCFFKNWE